MDFARNITCKNGGQQKQIDTEAHRNENEKEVCVRGDSVIIGDISGSENDNQSAKNNACTFPILDVTAPYMNRNKKMMMAAPAQNKTR